MGDLTTAREAWLILHGYGMQARGILHWFRHAEREGRVLVAPEGLSRFYVEHQGTRRVGASWMTREDRLHEIEDVIGYLDHVVAEVVGAIPRLEVHGFSQGVSAAARWAARTTRPVARLVCWAGAFPEDASLAGVGRATGGGPVHFVVGDGDKVVPREAVEADAARLAAGGLPTEMHRFQGTHHVNQAALVALG